MEKFVTTGVARTRLTDKSEPFHMAYIYIIYIYLYYLFINNRSFFYISPHHSEDDDDEKIHDNYFFR
jgi:hypothetical protein